MPDRRARVSCQVPLCDILARVRLQFEVQLDIKKDFLPPNVHRAFKRQRFNYLSCRWRFKHLCLDGQIFHGYVDIFHFTNFSFPYRNLFEEKEIALEQLMEAITKIKLISGRNYRPDRAGTILKS